MIINWLKNLAIVFGGTFLGVFLLIAIFLGGIELLDRFF